MPARRPLAGSWTRLRAALGLDFHILTTLLYRGWTILAGTATMVLLPLWLGPVLQGYYYTFSSLLALQIFFELGLSQVVVQLVGHEFAHLSVRAESIVEGEPEHIARLSSLVRLMRRWYVVSAGLFLLVAAPLGVIFFARKGGLSLGHWLGPWLLLVLATAVNLLLSPGLAIMEGIGRVGQVARLRLVQSGMGYVGLWLALVLGAGLWSAAVTAVVAVCGTSVWLWGRGELLHQLSARPAAGASTMHWRNDVFPFQWRIAVSWVSGYFIFNLLTPLVFSRTGAVDAGRLGLSLTMFNAISTVGMSWVNAKMPELVRHISRDERPALNALFKRVFFRSWLVVVGMSVAVVCGAVLLARLDHAVAVRIAPLPVLCCLAWSTAVNAGVFGMAVYMRAHREEPMLMVSVVTAVLTAAAAFLGVRFGMLQMMLLYTLIGTAVGLPWTLILFRRYYRRAPAQLGSVGAG